MLLDLLLFVPLAILTNSVFPFPFEPVLIFFVERYPPGLVTMFAAVGALCAGAAGFVDIWVMRGVGKWVRRGEDGPANFHRTWFYGSVLLAAFLPLPYVVVRLALVKGTPHPWVYALVIAAGRFPRYVLVVGAWQALALPWWASSALVIISLPLLVRGLRRRPAREAGVSVEVTVPSD